MDASPDGKVKVAILGSGNIGSDLMFKILRDPGPMELTLLAGIEPQSEGLARAQSLGVNASHAGIPPILEDPEIRIVFDATSAHAHVRHAKMLREAGRIAIDLTPAARGPYVIPPVNLGAHLDEPNVNMISLRGISWDWHWRWRRPEQLSCCCARPGAWASLPSVKMRKRLRRPRWPSSGISCWRLPSAVFSPGLPGAFAFQQISYYASAPFSPIWTFDALLIVFIGGLGPLAGPVIGAIFFVLVREQLAVRLVDIHQVIFGILFILIVLAFPGGLVEAWRRLRKHRWLPWRG